MDVAEELKYGNTFFLDKYSIPLGILIGKYESLPDWSSELLFINKTLKYAPEDLKLPCYVPFSDLGINQCSRIKDFKVALIPKSKTRFMHDLFFEREIVFSPEDLNEETGTPNKYRGYHEVDQSSF